MARNRPTPSTATSDLKADYVPANPPFSISDWGGDKLASDPCWVCGTPPASNAWLQHILWHLKPGGQAGVVLANGSMSSNQDNEGVIRKAIVEADLVEVMVALPPQLFFNTRSPPACGSRPRTKPSTAATGAASFCSSTPASWVRCKAE